jgi:hypothetical protein
MVGDVSTVGVVLKVINEFGNLGQASAGGGGTKGGAESKMAEVAEACPSQQKSSHLVRNTSEVRSVL